MHNGGRENIKPKVCLNMSLTSVRITAFVSPVSSRWFSQNLLHKESRKNGSVPTSPTALSYGLGQAPTLCFGTPCQQSGFYNIFRALYITTHQTSQATSMIQTFLSTRVFSVSSDQKIILLISKQKHMNCAKPPWPCGRYNTVTSVFAMQAIHCCVIVSHTKLPFSWKFPSLHQRGYRKSSQIAHLLPSLPE